MHNSMMENQFQPFPSMFENSFPQQQMFGNMQNGFNQNGFSQPQAPNNTSNSGERIIPIQVVKSTNQESVSFFSHTIVLKE